MRAIRTCGRAAVFALVVASPSLAAAAGFTWETDLEAAKQTAARTNRLLLVHFGAPWCQPCKQLEREVFNKPGFGAELQADFVGVKLNCDNFPATARQYGVQSIPTDVIITPDGKLVERLQSPLTGPEYITAMTRVARLARPAGAGAGTMLASAIPPASAAPPSAAVAAPAMNAPAAAAPIAQTPVAASPTDRYADYYNRNASTGAAAAPISDSASQPPAATALDSGAALAVAPQQQLAAAAPAAPPALPQAAVVGPALAAAAPAPTAVAPAPTAAASAAATQPHPTAESPQLPPGNAPLGLEGFCPVSLCDRQVWVAGDLRWGMQHRGRTYLFAGPEQQQKFLANPDHYSPVMSGDDPVLALDHGQSAPGSRMYGVSYGDHYYLFTSEQSLQTFTQNPKRYSAAAVQARR